MGVKPQNIFLYNKTMLTVMIFMINILYLSKINNGFIITRTFRKRTTTFPKLKWSPIANIPQSFGNFEKEIDPGIVKGTKLRILKYPHPKVHFFYFKLFIQE
jgi:hypothetical protein